MADRIHSYPMFPQSLTSNTLQQSQMPQQPPQSQQPDPQMISALSNPEHARMWQQMNQLQNAYRSQQSGDLAANHQMQEFARGQALSHAQGQSMVPQIQQSFVLNSQRMNSTIFHDPQTTQPQSLMPPNYSNMPVNTQQQMKSPFNMNPMMHGLNNPGVSRQLKMLTQQEIARLQQQSALGAQHTSNQPPSVDMFVSPPVQPSQDQMHGSPHPSAQPVGPPGPSQGMVSGNPQQNAQKRMPTPTEFQQKRVHLLSRISQTENAIGSLMQTARNGGPIDPIVPQKISQLRDELASWRDMYSKFMATYGGAMMTQQVPPPNMSHINSAVHSTSQHPPQTTVSNAQVQPGFVTQPNQTVTAPYNISAGNGSSPMTTQGQGALNQQIPIQPTHTQTGRPNTIPPRTGSTPHQITGNQLSSAVSPNLGNLAAQAGQKASNQIRPSIGIMPLDKQRFDSVYAQFCRSQAVNPSPLVPMGENGMVDLHQLHVLVMHEGGVRSVTHRDMWAVIGGRLGFVQFPGNDSEPARCGPALAQQLQNIYEQRLQQFENAYILTVKNRATAGAQQLAIDNNATPGASGNTAEMPSNPPRPPSSQHLIAAAVRYVHMSAQEMRAQRVQEPMIAFVESRRSELQSFLQQQRQLIAKRNAEQEQQNMSNTQGQVPNMHDQHISLPPQRPIGVAPIGNMTPGDTKLVNGSIVQENAAAGLYKRPLTQDQVQQAMMMIAHLKQIFQQRSLSDMPLVQVPDDQRLEYEQLLEQVYKMTSELDPKLHMYYILSKNEELLRRYITIVLTVARQRQLLSSPSSQYIITLNTLRNMQMQVYKINEEFDNRWRAMKASAMSGSHLSSTHLNHAPLTVPVHNTSSPVPPQTTGRSVSVNPPPPPPPQPSPSQSQTLPPPQLRSQTNQPQLHPQQATQQIKKPFYPPVPSSPSGRPASTTVASTTPPPAAAPPSTPATSAPTPQTTTGSPQTPKSPASKAVSKTKTTSRASRKLSTTGKGSAPPETAPPVAGVKRPSEEEVATLASVASSEAEPSNAPSPKKVKTEWEGEMSEALVKKQQEVENIKTDEDASAFFDRMLLAMTASTDEEMHHNIASTLGQIFAGMAQEPGDAAAAAVALSVHGAGDAGPPPTALSPHMGPANDAFLEYIDFSSFTNLEDEDSDSKAPTPDLDPSSEMNHSPESGSEGDLSGVAGSPDKTKIEESGDHSDPLRLGSLKEIDGGESAYYQVGDWKWEGTMHTPHQPWAIFTS